MQENWVQSLGESDPLEEGMATLSSISAWRIPMCIEAWPATIHGSQGIRHDWATKHTHTVCMLTLKYTFYIYAKKRRKLCHKDWITNFKTYVNNETSVLSMYPYFNAILSLLHWWTRAAEISSTNSMGPKGIMHLLILGRFQITRVPGKESQQIIGVNKFER